ncbi:MAG: DUF3800 domain-containing protein [Candidatus Omnitrophica bacterium]|nr:DUF3800 domain-containing protein [Candidatus Omnitrophota bacterium]
MALIVYLDETGDHTLELVDKEFPLFALALFICEQTDYTQKIVPVVNQLKMDFFGHEAVILHSRDIRRAQNDFLFLRNEKKRSEFTERLNGIMADSAYTLIVSVIRKQQHKDRYGMSAENPYDLALLFCLERLLPLLEEKKQTHVQIVAESRGKKEDDELMLSFLKITSYGSYYNTAERFKKVEFKLKFIPKLMNVVGIQLADLAAYPIARHVLDPNKPNPSYKIIEKKFYRGPGWVYGLKTFP